MKTIYFSVLFILMFTVKAQIQPFTDNDWTIEKIVSSDGSIILANGMQDNPDVLSIFFIESMSNYKYYFSSCEGFFDFNNVAQAFNIKFYACAITPNHSIIANHFLNIFILQEAGETQTSLGPVYGPFSYDFTYSGDFVYLHITNLAGSVATFYAENLSQENFLKESIFIYPNPVVEVLNIDNSGIAIDRLKIYDLSGRLVIEKENVEYQINVSQLQQGTYVLELETAVGVLREKLVKVD